MTSRLDELFSPGRVRQNWQMPIRPVPAPTRNALNQAIQAKYQAARGLIHAEFPDASRLSGKFEELAGIIDAAFPPEGGAAPTDATQIQTIVQLVEQLEELLWAMSLPQGDK